MPAPQCHQQALRGLQRLFFILVAPSPPPPNPGPSSCTNPGPFCSLCVASVRFPRENFQAGIVSALRGGGRTGGIFHHCPGSCSPPPPPTSSAFLGENSVRPVCFHPCLPHLAAPVSALTRPGKPLGAAGSARSHGPGRDRGLCCILGKRGLPSGAGRPFLGRVWCWSRENCWEKSISLPEIPDPEW